MAFANGLELPWLTLKEKDALARFTRGIRRALGPRLKEMKLFGSRARGERHDESDVDILILVEGLDFDTRYNVISALSSEVLTETGVPISTLSLKPEVWADWVDRELLITEELARDGVPL
jgi:predicted nucleotidyltransferase